MVREAVFYSLAPKPPAGGDKTYAAAAAGKVARGRKWFRLESRPHGVALFPAGATPDDVYDWLYSAANKLRNTCAAFSFDGEFFTVNSAALDSVPNGAAARDNAISLHLKGRDGWVVFLPEE